MYRSSFTPVGTSPIGPHLSGDDSGISTSGLLTIKSGSPSCHFDASANTRGGGMSAGLPRGDPLSTHVAILATSSSFREMSSLNCWTPTVLSMNHGGIASGLSRRPVRYLIDLAHGRTSSYVINDIGATPFERWQF